MYLEKRRSGRKSVFDDEENLKKLASMYESGCIQEASKHFGVSLSSCYKALEKAGINPTKSFFSDKKRYKKLVKMYEANYPMKAIAKHFKVSTAICYRALEGLSPKSRCTRTILRDKEKQAEFLKMVERNCDMQIIADHFGVSVSTCYRVLRAIR